MTTKRVFFLPNHDLQWLNGVIKTVKVKKGRILIIGSLLYGAYFPKNFKVIIIDKDPLALISQLYILWLKLEGYSTNRIKEILFINKFGDRLKTHSRFKFITSQEYSKSLAIFLKFSNTIGNFSKRKSIEKNFQKIFRLEKWKDGFQLHLIPKGLNSYDLLDIKPLRKLEEIEFKNASLENFKTSQKFDFIISTNVIENFDNPFVFFKLIHSLLANNGSVELTTYNKAFGRWLRYLKILINSNQELKEFFLGHAYLFKGKNERKGKEYYYKLKMDRNTFIFSKKEVNKILKLFSKKKFLPNWLRNIRENIKAHAKYPLFNTREKAYLIKDKKLIKIV